MKSGAQRSSSRSLRAEVKLSVEMARSRKRDLMARLVDKDGMRGTGQAAWLYIG
jgi:hypothetical protein